MHVDVADLDSLRHARVDTQAAYYLVHTLAPADFEQRDAEEAAAFKHAPPMSGWTRSSTWTGSVMSTTPSRPRSRRDVEQLLGTAERRVTVLRAAVMIGRTTGRR